MTNKKLTFLDQLYEKDEYNAAAGTNLLFHFQGEFAREHANIKIKDLLYFIIY